MINLQLDLSEIVLSNIKRAKILTGLCEKCIRIECSDHYLNKQLQHAFESIEIHFNKITTDNYGLVVKQFNILFFKLKKLQRIC
jgi:ABC-type cobalamin transport system ATPase subunit